MKKKIILAITGASGSLYSCEFLKVLQEVDVEVHAMISDAGRKVLGLELGIKPEEMENVTRWYDVHDFTAAMASGSSLFHGMVVLPCSMGTLAAIANGISANLIHRAADVTLKEQRPLILAVRETPLNRTHLHNMLKAHEAGAIICPPMPSFYQKPRDLKEMARAFAGRLTEIFGFQVASLKRWGDK